MAFSATRYRKISDLEELVQRLPARPAGKRLVLVPSSADRELFAQLWRRQRDDGVRTILWDDLCRLLALATGSAQSAQIDPPDHWLLLRQALTNSPEPSPLSECPGILGLLGDQIRELRAEDVPPQSVPRNSEASRLLADCFLSYEGTLRELNLTDSAALTTKARLEVEAAQKFDWPDEAELILAGFYSLTHSQLELIRLLRSKGVPMKCFVPDDGTSHAEASDLIAQLLPGEAPCPSPGGPVDVRILQAEDCRGEYETIARSLILWEATGHDGLKIGHPWPGWEALALWVPVNREGTALEVMRRYGVPCRRARTLKITDTPFWRLSQMARAAASQNWDAFSTSELMAHPAMASGPLPDKSPSGRDAWRDALPEKSRDAFDDACAFAQEIQSGGTPETLLAALLRLGERRLLTFFSNASSGTAGTDGTLDGQIAEYNGALDELRRKLLAIRETLRDLKSAGSRKLDGGDAWEYLTAWADGSSIRPQQPLGDALELWSGSLPVFFSRPYLFVSGLNASVWPGSLAETPLLSDADRQTISGSPDAENAGHLPLLSERRSQQEVLFRRLIASAGRLTILSWTTTDEKSRPLEPTPFLPSAYSDGWIASDPPTVSRGLDELLVPRDQPLIGGVEVRSPLEFAPWPKDRVFPSPLPGAKVPSALPMSAIDAFADCPYRFYVQNVLRLAPQETRPAYDRLLVGTATHKLWEMVWSAKNAGEKESIQNLSARFLDEALLGPSGYPELGTPQLARQFALLKSQIRRCAALQDKIDERLAPHRVKVMIETPLSLQLDHAFFRGRADRIDVLDDGSFLVWDYKLGKSEKYAKSFQLPLYALACEKSTGKRPAGWGFLGLRDGGCQASLVLPKEQSETGQAVAAALAEQTDCKTIPPAAEGPLPELAELLSSLDSCTAAGRWNPNWDSKDACRNCPYKELCRKEELHGESGKEDE